MSEQTMSVEIRQQATRPHNNSPGKLFLLQMFVSFYIYMLNKLFICLWWFCYLTGCQLFAGDREFWWWKRIRRWSLSWTTMETFLRAWLLVNH